MAAQVIGETMLRQESSLPRGGRPRISQSRRFTQLWSVRSLVLLAIGVFLTWQIVTRSLVAYLAEVVPERALEFRSSDPTALVNLAEKQLGLKLAAAKTESSNGSSPEPGAEDDRNLQIKQWAEQALLYDPLNARALRILGQLAAESADEERAEKLMDAAVRRSLRQSIAVYWLMRKSYERRDYGAAIRYADTLLRTRPQVMPQVAPILTRIAETKDSNGQVISVLADNPPWRAQFLGHLPNNISDARTPLNLLVALKDTATRRPQPTFRGI